jgi:hypothetical protein
MFFTYKEMDGEYLYMKNLSTPKVLGIEKVTLKMTFKKLLTLNNYVLYVVDIRDNLVSDLLLIKNSLTMVFDNDNFILTKSGMYVGNEYLCDSLFKMNVRPL